MSKGLGKGLEALIPSLQVEEDEKVVSIPLRDLRPNPYQPRKTFEQKSIQELKESIREHGVIQPIIVRKSIRGYEIIAGERRFRASKEAGLTHIPAVIKPFSESEVMEIALIENVQREDLNALEVATAYRKLMDKFDLTQEDLARKVGKSRPHVTNFLRLLQLPEYVQDYVSRGTLSMGHARALVGLKDQRLLKQLVKKVIEEDLSVRQLETLVKKADQVSHETTTKKKEQKNQFLNQYASQLQDRLGTSVRIMKGEKKGKIEIEFYSDEDLDRILQLFQDS
jgi:ParB family transcriptional regulator, chromosome partitioning protein